MRSGRAVCRGRRDVFRVGSGPPTVPPEGRQRGGWEGWIRGPLRGAAGGLSGRMQGAPQGPLRSRLGRWRARLACRSRGSARGLPGRIHGLRRVRREPLRGRSGGRFAGRLRRPAGALGSGWGILGGSVDGCHRGSIRRVVRGPFQWSVGRLRGRIPRSRRGRRECRGDRSKGRIRGVTGGLSGRIEGVARGSVGGRGGGRSDDRFAGRLRGSREACRVGLRGPGRVGLRPWWGSIGRSFDGPREGPAGHLPGRIQPSRRGRRERRRDRSKGSGSRPVSGVRRASTGSA